MTQLALIVGAVVIALISVIFGHLCGFAAAEKKDAAAKTCLVIAIVNAAVALFLTYTAGTLE